MRTLAWILRLAVFLLLLVLAARNSETVGIRFFFDGVWRTPLNLVMLVSFALGAAVGVTAGLATLARQRRDILRLKREAAAIEAELATARPRELGRR